MCSLNRAILYQLELQAPVLEIMDGVIQRIKTTEASALLTEHSVTADLQFAQSQLTYPRVV